jgi:hypothetical protein
MKKLVSSVLVIGALLTILVAGYFYGGSVLAQAPFDVRAIVWESTPQDNGQVEMLTPAGVEQVLVDFPAGDQSNWAEHCGQDYWSAKGQGAAIFAGRGDGSLAIYPLAGGDPVPLGAVNRMACAGPATFQFSPKGQRVGYINYAVESIDHDFPYGDIVFYDAAAGTQQATFDWGTAFTLYDDGALMLRMYPDGKGNATQADLDWWDGSGKQTLVTLEPVYPPDKKDVECGLTSGSVARVGNSAYVLTGQKCETGAVNWRLVSVPMSGGAATEIASGEPGGGYFPESFSTELLATKDGKGFLVAVPSGLARNTVRLQWVTPDGQVTPVLEGQHILVDRFGERLSEGRHMMLSADGSTLAFVTVSGSGYQSLWLLDLSTPGGTPVLIQEQGANERIFQYAWSPTNVLYYIGGSIESNSLLSVTPGGSPKRIERGRFFQLAVSYDGSKVAVAEWYANPDSVGDDLFKLDAFDSSGKSFVVKQGDKTHNQMIPLAVQ